MYSVRLGTWALAKNLLRIRFFATMAAAKTFCDDLIKSKPVVVFSKSYCPYCKKAKEALGDVPRDQIEIVELDQSNVDADAIQDYMLQLTNGRTVPRVFVGGTFFGGGDQTAAAKKSGELKRRLAEAGVNV